MDCDNYRRSLLIGYFLELEMRKFKIPKNNLNLIAKLNALLIEAESADTPDMEAEHVVLQDFYWDVHKLVKEFEKPETTHVCGKDGSA